VAKTAVLVLMIVVIMVGCIPLLMIAGLIEGFISPSDLPLWLKLTVSASTGVALYAYLLGSGRQGAQSATQGRPSRAARHRLPFRRRRTQGAGI